MTIKKLIIKGFFILLAVLALPFLIELLLNAHESNRNPWTKPSAIVTDGGIVREGLNRRAFKEIRFRSSGMRIYLATTDLNEAQADALVSDVTGALRVLQNGEEQLAYAFKLEENLRRNVGGLDSLESLTGTALMDIVDKFDVECRIVPATPADVEAADTLASREFDIGEAVEIAFMFEGDVPLGSSLRFTYSQCPRSLLHGTFFERAGIWLKRSYSE